MLTSFFGNSKPVHFLVLGGFLSLCFLWTVFLDSNGPQGSILIFSHIVVLVATVLSIIVLDFIVSKNQLTRRNSFTIFFYTCFLAMMSGVFLQPEMLWANFFLLLALRRIVSLRKEINSEKKILDAAVWITVASLFYFWSLLYFFPLLIAMVLKPNLTFKRLLIPLVGFFAVIIINIAFQIIRKGSFHWLWDWFEPIDFTLSVHYSPPSLVAASIILALIILSLTNMLLKFNTASLKDKSDSMMFLIIIAISFALSLSGDENNGTEMVFLFAPTAILCANFLEEGGKRITLGRKESRFKEILLWTVMLSAIVILVISL